MSCVPNVVSVPSVLSKVYCFFHCLRPVSCVPNVVSVPSVLSKVYCFFHCLRPVSCVPNVVSVPSVLSQVHCFFIVFVLCRVCPMLSVSLLFCLRFIVFFYCLRPVSCAPNAQCCQCVPSVLSKVYCFFYCLRPVSCVPNVASVPSVLSKVYCFFY